jgi:hypothetical protein
MVNKPGYPHPQFAILAGFPVLAHKPGKYLKLIHTEADKLLTGLGSLHNKAGAR